VEIASNANNRLRNEGRKEGRKEQQPSAAAIIYIIVRKEKSSWKMDLSTRDLDRRWTLHFPGFLDSVLSVITT
jgi:hypothetical protein